MNSTGQARRFAPSQVALVTGAAGDIGRAVAQRLTREGASVVLADIAGATQRLEESQQLCALDQSGEQKLSTVTFDVTDADQVQAAIATTSDDVGVPNLLFNNAGYQGGFANVVEADLADLERVLAVNVAGVFTVLQATAKALRAAGRAGSIVNTASMAGVGGAPNMAAYSASKGAVIALTQSAAKDLAPDEIRVNAVSPAFIGPGAMWDNQVRRQAEVPSIYYGDDDVTVADQMIGQVPMRRYGSVEEVAATVSFLLSDDASYVTGHNIHVAGGAG